MAKTYELQDRVQERGKWRPIIQSDHPEALADLGASLYRPGVEYRVVIADTGEVLMPHERVIGRRERRE